MTQHVEFQKFVVKYDVVKNWTVSFFTRPVSERHFRISTSLHSEHRPELEGVRPIRSLGESSRWKSPECFFIKSSAMSVPSTDCRWRKRVKTRKVNFNFFRVENDEFLHWVYFPYASVAHFICSYAEYVFLFAVILQSSLKFFSFNWRSIWNPLVFEKRANIKLSSIEGNKDKKKTQHCAEKCTSTSLHS